MGRTLELELNAKQAMAFRYLMDKPTKSVMYGGGGGAGKSWLGATWLWIMMNSYRGLRFAVCRKLINNANATFTGTFKKVLDAYGDKYKRYKMTSEGIYNLQTGSEIVFRSLIQLPSDPDFDRLGSLELTGAIIEEAQEVTRESYQVLRTRTGRQLNKELGITPKILLTCNPAPNFLIPDFVKKKDDILFQCDSNCILATSKDNTKYLPDAYLEQLQDISDPIVRARILEGSWDFTDLDTTTVIPVSLIMGCIGVGAEDGPIRVGIDVGGPQHYSDKTIAQPVKGNVIMEPIVIDSKTFRQSQWTYDDWLIERIIEIVEGLGITDMHDVRIDACGIGQPIYEGLRRRGYNCYPFRGSAKPLPRRFNCNKYNNLRTQALYELKELFRLHKLKLPDSYNETLVEDLRSIKYTEISGKIALEDKKFTRQRTGRSPDYGDALAMACLKLSGDKQTKDMATAI